MIPQNTIILPDFKLVFFCVPKAANSSIKAAILAALGVDVTEDVPHSHPALNLCRPEAVRRFKDYLRIAVVRNPFDRLVSFWKQKICTWRVDVQGHSRDGFHRDMPFEQCAAKVCENPHRNAHYWPQAELVRRPHFIGRTENLERDWEWIRHLAQPLELGKLPHYNKSEHGHYRDYYDWTTRRMVENTYAADLKMFGYSF